MNKIVFTLLFPVALALGAHAQDKHAADAGKKMGAAERKCVIDMCMPAWQKIALAPPAQTGKKRLGQANVSCQGD